MCVWKIYDIAVTEKICHIECWNIYDIGSIDKIDDISISGKYIYME